MLAAGMALAEDAMPPISIMISVADQKLVVLREGGLLRKYPISTSKFGVGDAYGSYKTPLGHMRVVEKIGEDLSLGAVLNHRQPTGEVLPANAKGRDPIVTRIIWLDGTEAQNQNARARGIYIHGTAEESKIGQPVSWGCIRMRSKDVVEVFDQVPVGTPVSIITDKLPRIAKYEPPKPVKAPVLIAARVPAKPPVIAAGPSATKLAVAATPTPTPARKIAQLPPTPTPQPTRVPVFAPAPLVVVQHHPEPTGDSTASLAMKGSMLMAGLPDGPSTLNPHPSLTERPVARPGVFSLPGEPATSSETTDGEKHGGRLALRAPATGTKAKP